ncbi:MAG: hypothetical protein L0Y57_03625 [Beijerinckiaceae bacterium]|nr:hypothetical protein [Beijerinckiaceae bacterium]
MIPAFSRAGLLAGGLAALGVPGLGHRQALADPLVLVPDTCTTINCDSLLLRGRINPHETTFPSASGAGWVAQLTGISGNCLRLHVTNESADLAMSVVAPDGVVFTNDNGGVAACHACPRVVVAASKTGVYTLVVNNPAGSGGAADHETFVVRAGLYNAGNPNCAPPTAGK